MGDVSEHAILAPSGAYQWRRCAGCIAAQRGLPDRAGFEAAEGTMFHAHAELALAFGLDPHDFPQGVKWKVDGHIVEYDAEMVDNMYEGLDWIRDQIRPGCIVFAEIKVPIERWTFEKGAKGTCDIVILFPKERRILMADWKYGKIAVVAEKNDQLTLYALGIWEKFGKKYFNDDPKNVIVDFRILQPRVPLKGSAWSTTMKKLLKEGESIKIDAKATYEENAPRTAGLKQCQYCRAASTCQALAEFNLKLFALKFEDIDEGYEYDEPPELQDAHRLTAERRSYVLLHKAMFTRWLELLQKDAMRDFAEGKPVPRMKVVSGRAGIRKYRQKQLLSVIVRLIRDVGYEEAYKRIMISPAETEKKIGKKRFKERYGDFVEQSPPKPALVPETDERPPLESKAMLFDIEDTDKQEGEYDG